MTPMARPVVRNGCQPGSCARTLGVGCLLAALALGGLQPAVSQTIPRGAGQIGEGAGPVEAPRRGLQSWVTEASVTSLATLTNNANYGESGTRAGDLILEVIPALRFNREGGRLRVDGRVALDMLGYVDGTQVNRVLPKANVLANFEAIDNFFFVDASLFADQFVENPFLAGSGYSSTNNLYTSSQVRLVPYFKGNIGQYTSWLVRSDNSYTWTSQTSNPLANAYYVRNLAEIVRSPTPFGLTLR